MDFTRSSVENQELRRVRVDHDEALEALQTLDNAIPVTYDLVTRSVENKELRRVLRTKNFAEYA